MHSTVQTPRTAFASYAEANPEGNLLHYGNGLLDSVFRFKSITESDRSELGALLSQVCNDKTFNDFVADLFVENNNTLTIKTYLSSITSYPSTQYTTALSVMKDVFAATTNETIRRFVIFLTTSIEDIYARADSIYSSSGMTNYTAFNHVVNEQVREHVEEQLENNTLVLPNEGITLLSFICQNDETASLEPSKIKYINIDVDLSKCSTFKDIYQKAIKGQTKLTNAYVRGLVVDGSFKSSVQVLSLVAPVWDVMQASQTLRDRKLPPMATSMSGGNQYSDADVVSIYTGSYGLVNANEPLDSSIALDQVTDHVAFNQLPNNQKLQVSHFLNVNRKRFNTILENSTKTVINKIRNALMSRGWESSIRSQQLIPQNASRIDYNSNSKVIGDVSSFMNKLNTRLSKTPMSTFSDAISFLSHEYIPMVSQFNFRCADKYGFSVAQHVMNKLSADPNLEILGVGADVQSRSAISVPRMEPSYSMAGGARGRAVTPLHETFTVDTFNGGSDVGLERAPREATYGYADPDSASGNKLISAFVSGQREFNRKYEELYRRLTRELAGINGTAIDRAQYNDLYTACGQFDSIAIKSPKTTAYLSGYYGAKDYNKLYTNVLEHSIQTLRRLGIKAFEQPTQTLEEMKRLMIETRAQMIKVKNQYITAPKASSEAFLVSSKQLKQESSLTNKDFIALSDAIGRLYALSKSITTPTNQNLQNQLKKYVEDIVARDVIIKNHYDEKIVALRHKFVSETSSDVVVTRDILVGFEEQKRDALLWLNKNVDAKLTQSRLDSLKTSSLSADQITLIEHAYTTFKNTQTTKEFQEDLRKIGRLLREANNGSVSTVYKLISKLKGVVKATQYFNFLSQLYEELKLLPGVNWKELEEQMVNLLVISSIDVGEVLNYSGGSIGEATYNELVYELSHRFEHYCQTQYMFHRGAETDPYHFPINSAAAFMRFILKGCEDDISKMYAWDPSKGDLTANGVALTDAGLINTNVINAPNGPGDNVRISVGGVQDHSINELVRSIKDFEVNAYLAPANIPPGSKAPSVTTSWFSPNVAKVITPNNIQTNVLQVIADYITWLSSTADGKPNLLLNTGGTIPVDQVRRLALLLKIVHKVCTEYCGPANATKIKPYFVDNVIYFVDALFGSGMADAAMQTLIPIKQTRLSSRIYRYSLKQHACHINEIELVNATFDALNANVLGVIDKYWSLRYSGNLNLPTNLSNILSGGELVNGGTLFDSAPINSTAYASVIVDAVPFYVCAFNVCAYYINEFGENRKGRGKDASKFSEYSFYIKVNKISTLYPVYKILAKDKDGSRLESLSDAQMRAMIAVFNNFWEQAEGANPGQKLTRAIDLLFNELNGCLLFSNKLQLDILKNRGKISNSIVDVLKRDINEFITSIQETITATFKDRSSIQSDEHAAFEHLLKDAYNRVKAEPDNRRIKTLQSIICNNPSVETRFSDYYKFMELVVVPLLLTAESYGHILKLFDTYSFSVTPSNDGKSTNLNLTTIEFAYRDLVNDGGLGLDKDITTALTSDMQVTNMWQFVETITRRNQHHLKSLLMENPVVLEWNRILLNNAFHNFHNTGRFELPKFWLVMDETTYPQTPELRSVTSATEFNHSDNLVIFKQLWPNIRAKNVGDYYTHCMNELRADYETCIHNFVAYPGISDKVAKRVSEISKDVLKPKELSETADTEEMGTDGRMHRPFRESLDILNNTQIELSNIVPVPRMPAESFLPKLFDPIAPCAELVITEDPKRVIDQDYAPMRKNAPNLDNPDQLRHALRLDGTSMYVVVNRGGVTTKQQVCNYSWIDWALYMLAKCDKTNFCLPYKLVTLLKNSNDLGYYLKPAFVTKDRKTEYTLSQTGYYENAISQNIMLRSDSVQNKEKLDYSMMNTVWVAGLVATTPYVISTLNAVKETLHDRTTAYGRDIKRDLKYMIEVLISFYDDISNFTPFMPFMADSIQISSSKPRPHLFAELLSLLTKTTLCDMDVNDFIKIEWANVDFFSELDNITFPAFKNKDKFEWIKSYAQDKFSSSLFATQFESTLKSMARNVWASLIAGERYEGTRLKNVNKQLDELIVDCINILSECDTGVIQKFIDNTVEYYSRLNNSNVSRHNVLTGGNFATIIEHVDTDVTDFYNIICNGIVANTSSVDGTISNIMTSDANTDKADFSYTGPYKQIRLDTYINDTATETTPHTPALNIMRDVARFVEANIAGNKTFDVDALINNIKVRISDFKNSNAVRDISNVIASIRFDNSWQYSKDLIKRGLQSYTDTNCGPADRNAEENQKLGNAQLAALDTFVNTFTREFNSAIDMLVDAYSSINLDKAIGRLRTVVDCKLRETKYGNLFGTLHYMYSYYRNFVKDVYEVFRQSIRTAVRIAKVNDALGEALIKRCTESAYFGGRPTESTVMGVAGGFANEHYVRDVSSNAPGQAAFYVPGAPMVGNFTDPQRYARNTNDADIGGYNAGTKLNMFNALSSEDRVTVSREECGITDETPASFIAGFDQTRATQNADGQILASASAGPGVPAVGDSVYSQISTYRTSIQQFDPARFHTFCTNVAAHFSAACKSGAPVSGGGNPKDVIYDMLGDASGSTNKALVSNLYYGTSDATAHPGGAFDGAHTWVLLDIMNQVINMLTNDTLDITKPSAIKFAFSEIGRSNAVSGLASILRVIRDDYQSFITKIRQHVVYLLEQVDNIAGKGLSDDAMVNQITALGFSRERFVNIRDNVIHTNVNKYLKIFDTVTKAWAIKEMINPATLNKDYFKALSVDNNDTALHSVSDADLNDSAVGRAYRTFEKTYNEMINEISAPRNKNRLLGIDFAHRFELQNMSADLLKHVRPITEATDEYFDIMFTIPANVRDMPADATGIMRTPPHVYWPIASHGTYNTALTGKVHTVTQADLFKRIWSVMNFVCGSAGDGSTNDFSLGMAGSTWFNVDATTKVLSSKACGNATTSAGRVSTNDANYKIDFTGAGADNTQPANNWLKAALSIYAINANVDGDHIHGAVATQNGIYGSNNTAGSLAAVTQTLIGPGANQGLYNNGTPAQSIVANDTTMMAGTAPGIPVAWVLPDTINYLRINTVHAMAQYFIATMLAQGLDRCPDDGDYSNLADAAYNFSIWKNAHTFMPATAYPLSGHSAGTFTGKDNLCMLLRFVYTAHYLSVKTHTFGSSPATRSDNFKYSQSDAIAIRKVWFDNVFMNEAIVTEGTAATAMTMTGGYTRSLSGGFTVDQLAIRTKIFKEARFAYQNTSAVPANFNPREANAGMVVDKYTGYKITQMYRGFDLFTKFIANPLTLGRCKLPLFEGIGMLLHPQELTDIDPTHIFAAANGWCETQPAAATTAGMGGRSVNGSFLLHLIKSSLIYDYYVRSSLHNHKVYIFMSNVYILGNVFRQLTAGTRTGSEFKNIVRNYVSLLVANPFSFEADAFACGSAAFDYRGTAFVTAEHPFVMTEVSGKLLPKILVRPHANLTNIADVTETNWEASISNTPIDMTTGNAGAPHEGKCLYSILAFPSDMDHFFDNATAWSLGKTTNIGAVAKNDDQLTLPHGLQGGADPNAQLRQSVINPNVQIRQLAVNIAQSANARAIYIDNTITANGFVPTGAIGNGGVAVPPASMYLYKFLYNPRLASSYNNSELNDSDFVSYALGKEHKFIIDPLGSYNTSYTINPSSIKSHIVHPYAKAYQNLGANRDVYARGANSQNILNISDVLYTRLTGENLNDTIALARSFINAEGQLNKVVRETVGRINPALDVPSREKTTLQSPEFPCNSLIRRTVHNIHLDENMIANVPYSKALESYLFSPQKDIFNATFRQSVYAPRSPTLNIGINDVAYNTTSNPNRRIILYSDIYTLLNDCNADDSFYRSNSVVPLFSVHSANENQIISYNVVHQFLDKLLVNNEQYMFNYIKSSANVGFDVGIHSDRLFGGAIKFKNYGGEDYTNRFINMDAEIIGSTAKELVQVAYNVPTNKDQVYEDGQQLYCNLFRTFDFGSAEENYKHIFAYVADYFNKHSISFNAIYNQLCFTSIIYSSAVYKSYLPKFRSIFSGSQMSKASTSGPFANYKLVYSMYEYIRDYLSKYTNEHNLDAATLAEDPSLQVLDARFRVRGIDSTFKSLHDILGSADGNNGHGSGIRTLSNQYTSPTINNNIFSELVNLTTYIPSDSMYKDSASQLFTRKDYTNKTDSRYKDCEYLDQLMPSGVMNTIRHFDTTATFIYTMFLWLRHTSFYDNKKDADVSYFGNQSVEPFSITGQ